MKEQADDRNVPVFLSDGGSGSADGGEQLWFYPVQPVPRLGFVLRECRIRTIVFITFMDRIGDDERVQAGGLRRPPSLKITAH